MAHRWTLASLTTQVRLITLLQHGYCCSQSRCCSQLRMAARCLCCGGPPAAAPSAFAFTDLAPRAPCNQAQLLSERRGCCGCTRRWVCLRTACCSASPPRGRASRRQRRSRRRALPPTSSLSTGAPGYPLCDKVKQRSAYFHCLVCWHLEDALHQQCTAGICLLYGFHADLLIQVPAGKCPGSVPFDACLMSGGRLCWLLRDWFPALTEVMPGAALCRRWRPRRRA